VAVALWFRFARGRPAPPAVLGSLAAVGVAALAFAYASGPRHDYLSFLMMWDGILDGKDPWDAAATGRTNAYPPLYVALAPLTLVHRLLPKLLFTAAWLAVAGWFVRLYAARSDTRHGAALVLGYFVLLPYFWVEVALYGHFDILPAIGTLLALHLTLQGRELAGGVILGLATLLKIFPLAALPFLLVTHRRNPARLAGGCALTIAVGALAGYALWGTSAFKPLSFAAQRESRLLSIFQFLRGDYSPLRLVTDAPNVDWLSKILLAVAMTALLAAAARRHMHPVVAVTSAFVVLFALYTLGNPQFQMIVFLLVPYLYVTLPASVRLSPLLVVPVAAYLAWYSAFDVVYVVGGMLVEWPWNVLRQVVGLPTFLIAAAALAGLVSAGGARPIAAP
jgi:hypothetical protein